MATKDVNCPGCKKSVLTCGFYHDTTLAMKCSNCNTILMPTAVEDENRCRGTLQGGPATQYQKRDLLPIRIGD